MSADRGADGREVTATFDMLPRRGGRFRLALPLCALCILSLFLLIRNLRPPPGPGDDALSPSPPDRAILVVVAHPDDEALWAGDFLARHGGSAHVVVAAGRGPGWFQGLYGSITSTRRREFRAVAHEMGFQGEYLPGRDHGLVDRDLDAEAKERIGDLVCGRKWDTVLTHGPEGEYGHPMHHRVHDAVLTAARRCCRNADGLRVFFPFPSPDDRPVWTPGKVRALELYGSQRNVVFRNFRRWEERIVPLKDYDLEDANKFCMQKNLKNPKGGNFCRMASTTQAEFEASLNGKEFSGEGIGC